MSVITAAVLDRGMAEAMDNGSCSESQAYGRSLGQSRTPRGFHWLREGERRRYPDYLLPIAGQLVPDDERFAEAREQLLLGYGLQTARAYRADLDDVYAWSVRRGLDLLRVTDAHVGQYVALLRRRKYSAGTIRRRKTSLRLLRELGKAQSTFEQTLFP